MLLPTARTTPLTSLPKIAGIVRGKSCCLAPDRIFKSMGLTLVAAAATNTESALSVGSGTSTSNLRFSGPPYSYKRTAFMIPPLSDSAAPTSAAAVRDKVSCILPKVPDSFELVIVGWRSGCQPLLAQSLAPDLARVVAQGLGYEHAGWSKLSGIAWIVG